MDLSIVIITLNEEANLPECLGSLPEGAEVIIVDSHSTDATVDIAQSRGAKVQLRVFDSYDQQKNYAMSLATKSWILSIDADEVLSAGLCGALERIVNSSNTAKISSYRISRRLVFMGKELRWGKTRDKPIRLMKKGSGHFEGAIHETMVVDKNSLSLVKEGYIQHHSYKDLTDYFDRFNRYTTRVARDHLDRAKEVHWMNHLLRPWVEFFLRYFIRLGFLDGYPGYVYALNSSLYAFTKYSKLIEMRAKHAESK